MAYKIKIASCTICAVLFTTLIIWVIISCYPNTAPTISALRTIPTMNKSENITPSHRNSRTSKLYGTGALKSAGTGSNNNAKIYQNITASDKEDPIHKVALQFPNADRHRKFVNDNDLLKSFPVTSNYGDKLKNVAKNAHIMRYGLSESSLSAPLKGIKGGLRHQEALWNRAGKNIEKCKHASMMMIPRKDSWYDFAPNDSTRMKC